MPVLNLMSLEKYVKLIFISYLQLELTYRIACCNNNN